MSVFNTNQARQLYVATSVSSNANPTSKGAVYVGGEDNTMYFQVVGEKGITRSDIIDLNSITYAKAVKASAMQRKLKSVKITVNADGLDSSNNLIAGEDYIVRLVIRQAFGMSDEDTYIKYGCVHATSGMGTSAFYYKLKESFDLNFKREISKWFDFSLATNAIGGITFAPVENTGIKVTVSAADSSASTATLASGVLTIKPKTGETAAALNEKVLTATSNKIGVSAVGTYATASNADIVATGVIVSEAEQEWVLGTKAQVPVYFEVLAPTIVKGTSKTETVWLATTDNTNAYNKVITNGKLIADLEYFCHGERGDIYRNVSWPNVIPTKLSVDPTAEYSVIELHYAYQGSCEDIQKSEKDITIVVPNGASGSVYTVINSLIGKINAKKTNLLSTLS